MDEQTHHSFYWRVKDGVGDYSYIVCTTKVRPKIKTKIEPFSTRMGNGGKVLEYQYKVKIDSEEQIKLFEELGLTKKHRRTDFE